MKKGKNPIWAIKNKGYRMVSRITVGSSHNVALATLYQVCLMPYGITLLCKDTNLPLVRFANVGCRLARHSLPLWWQTNEFPWWFTPSLCFAKTESSPLTRSARSSPHDRRSCQNKSSTLLGATFVLERITGLEPATFALARRRSTKWAKSAFCGASGRNRTNDTGIFSPLLYQLSYRGICPSFERLLFPPFNKSGDPKGTRTPDL